MQRLDANNKASMLGTFTPVHLTQFDAILGDRVLLCLRPITLGRGATKGCYRIKIGFVKSNFHVALSFLFSFLSREI